jgi:long-chain acyl-CoA synthetase
MELKNQQHLAILAPSSPEWVASYLAVLRAGGVAVPIDKELKAAELRHILVDSEARMIFVARPQLDTLLEILDDLPRLEKIILIDIDPGRQQPSEDEDELYNELTQLLQQIGSQPQLDPALQQKSAELLAQVQQKLHPTRDGAQNIPPVQGLDMALLDSLRQTNRLYFLADFNQKAGLTSPPQTPADCAVILYTSGTTGRSKGAMLSHQNIVSNITAASRQFQLDSSIHTLSFLPINHVFEQVCGILLPLSLGGKVSFAESIKKLGDNLNEVKPTFLLGVPAVYRLLYDRVMKNIQQKTLSRFLFNLPLTRKIVTGKVQERFGRKTIFVSGGAALDPAVAHGFKTLGLTLLQGYGITETSPVISAETPDRLKPGTVGLPFEQVEVRIENPNNEGVGEIKVRGPNVMLGYYKNEKATREVLHDGWYSTGDLGRIDEEGMLEICGRVKNLIVTPNGKNVYPEEVENQLLNSPFIAEIMVYGHKVSDTAEEVYASIFPCEEALFEYQQQQAKEPLTPAEVEALIRKEVLLYSKDLADYKRLKKFSLREDEFPKTTTRKIKRYVVEPEVSME